MKPHPHAAIIKAFADDPDVSIEFYDKSDMAWFPAKIEHVLMHPYRTFRLAPKEPQPEKAKRYMYLWMHRNRDGSWSLNKDFINEGEHPISPKFGEFRYERLDWPKTEVPE